MSELRAGIVVVNYGSADLLQRHFADRFSASAGSADLQLIVVDNYSDDTQRQAVDRLCAAQGWQLVAMPDNRGFGPAVNAGTARATLLGCDVVILVNPDAIADPLVVRSLADQARSSPGALLAPRIVASSGAPYFIGAQVAMRRGRTVTRQRPVALSGAHRPWVTGACAAFSVELFDRAHGFDESYFLYWEDIDFSMRVQDCGGSLELRLDLTVEHDEGGTQGPRAGRAMSGIYYRYNCRNRLLFGVRHLERRRDLLRWIVLTPRESWLILMRGGRRQLLHDPRLAWHAFVGSCEGIALAARALLTSR